MSLLNTPFWQDLGGNPRTGVNPPSLVVRSGRLTPQRHGEIQQIYMRFSMAKLTAVGEFFVFNRVLTDGTRVRIESMQGRDRVMVWASDADQASEWDYGWAFIPVDKDSPESGYVRKPGTGQGGLNRDSFRAYVATDGTKNFTFVDGKTGKRSVSDGRMGGERIWRGPQNKGEILTYDRDYVYYKGARISSHLEGGKYPITISGAAIAKGVDGYWIVIISENSMRGWVAAMRLPKVGTAKEIKGRFVDCGDAIESTATAYPIKSIWNFSPDGLNAVCVGAASDNTTVLHKIKLTAVRDSSPFVITSEVDTSYRKPQRVVSNEFAPEEAKRVLRWYGWKDFSYLYNAMYHAIHNDFVAGTFGPYAAKMGDMRPGYVYPGIYESIAAGAELRLSSEDFVYADSDLPEEILIDEGNVGGFIIDRVTQTNTETVYGQGGNNQYRMKIDVLGALIVYNAKGRSTPLFQGAEELVQYCESKWNDPRATDTGVFRRTILGRINSSVGIKSDYKNLTEAANYIYNSGGFIYNPVVVDPPLLQGQYRPEDAVLTYVDGEIREIDQEEMAAIKGRPNIYDLEQIDYYPLSQNNISPIFNSIPRLVIAGVLSGKPNYTNHYKIRWTFRSAVAVEGSQILAAGYDKNGELRVTHIEADAGQKIIYTSEIVADDEAYPRRRTTYSGGYTCKLKVNDVVVDDVRFTVSDSFEGVLNDENLDMYARYIPQSGMSPRIESDNLHVWDVDEYLGHVLYRKFESTASALGEVSEERRTQYSISFADYLYTPSKKYELGEKETYSSAQRTMPPGYATFFNTADAVWRFGYGISVSNKTVVDGIEFFTTDNNYVFGGKIDQIIPEDQKNPRENLYGWDDKRYDPRWVRNAMFLFAGANGDPYRHPSPIVHGYAKDISEAVAFGRFESPPAARVALRSFSDDAWMVCVCEETNTKEVHREKTTAGFFIKTGKGSPVKKVDAARDFPFLLSESPKLLRPTFYIGQKK